MEIKLVVVNGVHAGKEIRVRCARFIIGRSKECQLRPGCDLVSRRHCAIVHEDGQLLIEDLGSTNGTFLNSEQVETPRELNHGDRLGVGTMEFDVRLFENVFSEPESRKRNDSAAAGETVTSHPKTKAAKEKKAVKERNGEQEKAKHAEARNGQAHDTEDSIAEANHRKVDAQGEKNDQERDDLDMSNWFDDELDGDLPAGADSESDSSSHDDLPDTATIPWSRNEENGEKDEKDEKKSNIPAANRSETSAQPPPSPKPAVKKTDSSQTAATDVLDKMYRFMK